MTRLSSRHARPAGFGPTHLEVVVRLSPRTATVPRRSTGRTLETPGNALFTERTPHDTGTGDGRGPRAIWRRTGFKRCHTEGWRFRSRNGTFWPVGTVASMRTFLERRSLTVCWASLIMGLSAVGFLPAFHQRPALQGAWGFAFAAYAAALALLIWVAAWVNLIRACARGYSSSRCQIGCLVLCLAAVPALISAGAVLDRLGTL